MRLPRGAARCVLRLFAEYGGQEDLPPLHVRGREPPCDQESDNKADEKNGSRPVAHQKAFRDPDQAGNDTVPLSMMSIRMRVAERT